MGTALIRRAQHLRTTDVDQLRLPVDKTQGLVDRAELVNRRARR